MNPFYFTVDGTLYKKNCISPQKNNRVRTVGPCHPAAGLLSAAGVSRSPGTWRLDRSVCLTTGPCSARAAGRRDSHTRFLDGRGTLTARRDWARGVWREHRASVVWAHQPTEPRGLPGPGTCLPGGRPVRVRVPLLLRRGPRTREAAGSLNPTFRLEARTPLPAAGASAAGRGLAGSHGRF